MADETIEITVEEYERLKDAERTAWCLDNEDRYGFDDKYWLAPRIRHTMARDAKAWRISGMPDNCAPIIRILCWRDAKETRRVYMGTIDEDAQWTPETRAVVDAARRAKEDGE